MRDLVILTGIFIFFVFYGVLVYAMAQDTTLQGLDEQNTSFFIPQNVSNIDNDSNTATIPIFQTSYESKSKTGLSMIWAIATLGLSTISGTPVIVILIITSFNYFLLMMTYLLIYRLIRHGGG